MVIASRRQYFPQHPTQQRVQAFEQRYGVQATQLAAHAAFPLTLTTDVVYCLRQTFLPECPWYAAADVLLSGLCTPAGHDLYEMEAGTRRYLLRYLRDQFDESRIHDLERFMVAYLRHRLTTEDSDHSLILGEKPHWTALACLRPGDAFDEIRQTLERLALQEVNPAERFRLASLVESYGDFLADRGYQPLLLDMADRVAEGEPVDTTAALASDLKTAGFTVSLVDFEIATVTFGEVVAEAQEADLKSFDFQTVTVNDRGEEVHTEAGQAFYFEEPLAENIPPLKLMAIPSGEFMMGSPEDESARYGDESPQHLVKVAPFFIGQTPVTQAQWRAVAALPKQAHDLDTAPASFKGDERPVEQVSWYEAVEFCERLSEHTGRIYRLPTEAEWEYACRADTTTPFYFGATITTELANYSGRVYLNEPEGNSRGETTLVGQFPPNAFGLYDMHGNVWEWCQDHWPEAGNYEGAPNDGSAWLTENADAARVRRGGSWNCTPRLCRSAVRNDSLPGGRNNAIGFRVVCEARGL